MEDPSSLLVDSDSHWQIPYSPLISEEPVIFSIDDQLYRFQSSSTIDPGKHECEVVLVPNDKGKASAVKVTLDGKEVASGPLAAGASRANARETVSWA